MVSVPRTRGVVLLTRETLGVDSFRDAKRSKGRKDANRRGETILAPSLGTNGTGPTRNALSPS
jgi:hypothetical protein